jgi:nucleoside-diphosphate-sugar epimerase
MDWSLHRVLVTGGASFIGSHLVEALVGRNAPVRVVDDLSSGKIENIQNYINGGRVQFIQADLRDAGVVQKAVEGMSIVFHLAADHGGRGYVDTYQADCATNLAMDGMLFWACHNARVEKIVYASSGCVYPNYLQGDVQQEIYLTEDLVKAPHDADNMYGWAKLMGELTLKAYSREWGMRTACCRYFTVYGERGVENHAVIAMIARAFIKQDPFEVWGTGEQIRNWTYVKDIVEGTILAAEIIDDGTAINLGTMERIRVLDAVHEILSYTGHRAAIKLRPEMPTGPLNRVADNSLAGRLLGWVPEVQFIEGLHRTIDWYFSTKNVAKVKATLDRMLIAR